MGNGSEIFIISRNPVSGEGNSSVFYDVLFPYPGLLLSIVVTRRKYALPSFLCNIRSIQYHVISTPCFFGKP